MGALIRVVQLLHYRQVIFATKIMYYNYLFYRMSVFHRAILRLQLHSHGCPVHRLGSFRARVRMSSSDASSATGSKKENPGTVTVLGQTFNCDGMTNVTPSIVNRVGRNLHCVPQNPINIIKQRIVHHFHRMYTNRTGNAIFAHFDNVSPVVTTEQNFDSLLVPKDHVARSKNDNYYINSSTVLRAHTSAHQRDFIKMGLDRFLVTGDVYRRDEIDSSHYPVFHQMEGVRLFTKEELFASSDDPKAYEIFESDPSMKTESMDRQSMHTVDAVKMLEFDLKRSVVDLMKELFGASIESRWNPCYFPFTHPSYELEIKFQGEWLEVLGSGIMRQAILDNGGAHEKIGWAFGLGLDRLAMLLFNVPDIRLFWSEDPRFAEQFREVGIDPQTNIQFTPFSKFPPCSKDVSFWLPPGGHNPEESDTEFSDNNLYEVVRSIGGDYIEKVELIDRFTHPKTQRVSRCYRVTYRSMDRNLTNEEINEIQEQLRRSLEQDLGVELR